MSTGWTCGRQPQSEGSCPEWSSLERELGGSLPQSAQGKWMTVTLPSGQLTVILAVGLTCWPYLFCAVCLIISGIEELICVCKVDRWPSRKENKGHSSSAAYFFCVTANTPRSLVGIWGCRFSPVGLKESYLLLLPITPQSPALSTCKMTLGMPVLMVLYRLRLCFSVMRPMGAWGSHSLPLKSLANWAHSQICGRKVIFIKCESERGCHVCLSLSVGSKLTLWIGVQFQWAPLS